MDSARQATPSVTLVIPALNEAGSIGEVTRSFKRAAAEANATIFRDNPVQWEVLVVDGVSEDGTRAIAEAEGARVIVESRLGYGRAYKTGFAAALGCILCASDGDSTYPVEVLPALVHELLENRIDFLFGNRFARLSRGAMSLEHRIGNRVLNTFTNVAYHRYLKLLSGHALNDSQSGFWVFRRQLLSQLDLKENGMAFSEELKIEAITKGFHVVEAPIEYRPRSGSPKLSSWRDGLGNLRHLASKRFEIARQSRSAHSGLRPGETSINSGTHSGSQSTSNPEKFP